MSKWISDSLMDEGLQIFPITAMATEVEREHQGLL